MDQVRSEVIVQFDWHLGITPWWMPVVHGSFDGIYNNHLRSPSLGAYSRVVSAAFVFFVRTWYLYFALRRPDASVYEWDSVW